MSVYDTIGNLLVERYGVHLSEGANRSRGSFSRACARSSAMRKCSKHENTACKHYDNPVTALSKLGGILYNRSLFSSFIEEA